MKSHSSKHHNQTKLLNSPQIVPTSKMDTPLFKIHYLKLAFGSTILASSLWLSGCNKVEEDTYEVNSHTEEAVSANDVSVSDMEVLPEDTENLAIENLSNDTEARLGSQTASIDIPGKELLISADADFKVDDVVKSSNAIETLTRQQGGYIESSSISSRTVDENKYVQGDKEITFITYYRQADLIVRIPKPKVNDFLRQVQSQVKFLNHQQFTAQDVTLDLQREKLKAQLNKDMARDLNQEKLDSDNEKEQGGNVDTIKETYSALQRQQLAELEKKDLTDRINFSTLQLSFTQPESVYKEVTDNIDSLVAMEQPSFLQQVKTSLVDGWETIKNVVLWLISLWWLAILAIIFYFIYRLVKPIFNSIFTATNRNKKKINTPVVKDE